MQVTNFILATAGHVDHGKSALVTALTGIDPDRLPEEKARGITIELGFAHFDLASADGSRVFRIGVVDVPGHEDFVKNMVAGVGSIDAALLVVAADDGWMPQTEEHLQILSYLGVKHAVVALSKIDLARESEAKVTEAIRRHLRDSPLSEASIVPTSTRDATSIDNLRRALAELFVRVDPPRDIGKPRLAVDRAFALRGVGTVVTGTLAGGQLQRGGNVVIQPARITTRIRNIQSYNQDVAIANPGSRVALHLADVEPRSDRQARDARTVGRGDVVTLAELGDPTSVMDVMLTRAARAERSGIKSGAWVRLHHGTSATTARIQIVDDAQIAPGGCAPARLRLRSPLFAFGGDRFVIRDASAQHTLAGGLICEVRAPKKPMVKCIGAKWHVGSRVEVWVAVEFERSPVLERATLLVQSQFSRDAIDATIARDLHRRDLVEHNGRVLIWRSWQELRQRAEAAIDRAHLQHPDRAGCAISDLRDELLRENHDYAPVIDALLEELCADGFVRRGPSIARASHLPALPPTLQAAGEAIRKALRDNPFDPPSRAQLTISPNAHQSMKFLLTSGEVVEVSKEIVLSSTSLHEAITRVRAHIVAKGPATVSELKTLLNSSRRVMVPLLEKLDRDGITRREGDRRSLR